MNDEIITLGDILPPINFDEVHAMTDVEVQNFRDNRGYNLLMLASEAGHIGAVNNLIERGEDVNFEVGTESAASLAFARGHHQVVLALLQANAKVPHNYNHETALDELRMFVELSEVMHGMVRDANEADEVDFEGTKTFLRENIEANPSVMHFYDQSNVSLLKRAALSSMFGIYELLLTLNIFFAPHENLEEIFSELSDDDRKKLRDITFGVSPNLLTEEMMILMRNCKLGPESPRDRHSEFMKIIRDAFEILFQYPSIAAALKVVAASFDFKIVFDFKRDSVTFLDPSSEPFTDGIFYLTGRIFIGAKDMLNPSAFNKVVGVIAHELCHYAMFLVYGNLAKPYKEKNVRAAERFELISQECERLRGSEELVRVVYDAYDEEMWHAELIVRVCHMRAFYFNAVEILNEKREIFADLFNFFDDVCVREMEAAIPKIQRKFNPFKKAQRKVQIQRRWIITLVISLLLSVALSVWGLIHFYNPTLTFKELSVEDQNRFKNALVYFHGVDVKFGELFDNDSGVYDLLSSEQIKNGLKNETKELCMAIALIFDNFVFLKFSNMTKELKEKFLEFDANFQGQNVSLKSLTNNEEILDLLDSSQVKEIFKSSQLKVANETEIKTKFVIERFFIDEDKEISERYYDNGRVSTGHKDIKSFIKIIFNLNKEKVFLLSSVAGEGKSTTFRHFSLKLKKIFPTKWIQFVDLKKHSKAYEKYKNVDLSIEENLLNFLSLDLLKLEGIKLKVFIEFFGSGNLIFLWDGIDEVSPIYKDFMIKLITSIRSNKNILQFISTRPQHSKKFQEKLNVKAQKLVPLGDLEAFELCIKFIAYEKFKVDGNEIVEILKEKSLINENFVDFEEFKRITQKFKFSHENYLKMYSEIEKSFKILKSLKVNSQIIKNPLLIRLIAEVSSEDFEVNANASVNLYEVYNIIIVKKFKIVQEEKGEIVFKDARKVQTDSRINIMQVIQAYAIKSLNIYEVTYYGNIYEGFRKNRTNTSSKENLQVMKSIGKVSEEEISRFGILQVYSGEDFDFVHRTFAEFFLAEYFIATFSDYDVNTSSDDKENVLILYNLFFEKSFEISRKFLINYLESETGLSPFFQLLRKQFVENKNYKTDDQYANGIIEIIKFFSENNKNSLLLASILLYFMDLIDVDNKDFEIFWNSLNNAELDKKILHSCLFALDSERRTIVHKYFLTSIVDASKYENQNIQPFLSLINKALDSSQIPSLFLMEDKNNLNVLAYALRNINDEQFRLLWEFIEKKLSESDLEKLLLMENNSCGNALHYSAFNDEDKKVFINVLKKIMNKNFIDEEIRKLLMKRGDSCPTTLHGLIENSELSTIQGLMKYFEIALRNNKEDLKKFLSHRDGDGDSIFNIKSWEHDEKIKLFRNFFKRTFNDNEKFEESFKSLETRSKVLSFFGHSYIPEDLKELRTFKWILDDFEFVVNNWGKIHERLGQERLKTVLTSKNGKGESLLFDIAKLNKNKNSLQVFLTKIKGFLNEREFLQLFEGNKENITPLMFATLRKNGESLKMFWEFLDKNLKENDKQKFLAENDNEMLTALQWSTFNKHPNSFTYMKGIYDKFITQNKIREKFLQMNPKKISFIEQTIVHGTANVAENAVNYLKGLFDREKENLRKILSYRDEKGETIFSKFKNENFYYDKVELMEDLLWFTFQGTGENYEEFLNGLKSNLKKVD